MKQKIFTFFISSLIVCTLSNPVMGQVCSTTPVQNFTNSTPVTIPTTISVTTSTLVVTGAPIYLTDLNLTTFLTHTFNSDVDMTLTSPAGTVVTLTTDNGSSFDNVFNGTVWDDDANPAGQVPYTSNNGVATEHVYTNLVLASPLVPEENLGAFNGENPNGTWTITISDDAGGDGGILSSWTLGIIGFSTAPTTTLTTVTNSTPVTIPTTISVTTSTITVAGAGTQLLKATVLTMLTHTFNADVDMTLTSPAGTVVTLTTDNGGGFDNVFNGTLWDDKANPAGQVPYTTNNGVVTDHTFADNVLATPLSPEEALSAFVGENPNGVWTITISDDAGGDGGTLTWTLNLLTSTCPAALVNCTPTAPQVFTNSTPVTIPTTISVTTSTLVVSGAPTYLFDLNLTTFLTHTFNSDVDMTLTSPAGTVVTLTTDNGSSFDNVFNGTVWDDDANPAGQVPYTSNNGVTTDHVYTNLVLASPLVPEENLGAFNGENPNGVWTITISDDAGGDGGILSSWSLGIVGLSATPTTTLTTVTNSTPVTIPTTISVTTSTITIAGAGTQLLEATVNTMLTHTFNSDVDMTLTSPAGTVVTLTTDNGGGFDNVFNGTLWDDNANPAGQVPYTTNNGVVTDHTFADNVLATPLSPEEALSAFVGENPNGVWTITISDDAGGDGGTLTWTLNLLTSTCPAPSCTVTCPANMTVSNDPGICGAIVNYPAPTTSGSCGAIATFPLSGTVFNGGSTVVNAYNTANQKIYGLTNTGLLVSFNLGSPGTVSVPLIISGMQAGDVMMGIDFRPLDNVLYGFAINAAGTDGRLYTINTTTGAATAVGAAPFPVTGTEFGFDFNPTVDRIRLVSNSGLNIRLNPATGTVAATDVPLNPGSPQVSAAAYTNSFVGATTTTLFDIDYAADALYIQNPPNGGVLVLVGPLGVDATSGNGFDISQSGIAVAAFPAVLGSDVYTINLTTGAATLIGNTTGVNLRGLAITPLSQNTPSCNFTVTVNDTQLPTITCPAPITSGNTPGNCGASLATPAPTTADNCAVTRLTWALTGATTAASPATGINNLPTRNYNVGVTTVTYTVADAAGNTATCQFTITVSDTQPPTITCPANVTVSNTPNLCTGIATYALPVAADNCAPAGTVSDFSNPWTNTGQRGVFFDVSNIGGAPITITSLSPAMWGTAALTDNFSVYFTTSASTWNGNQGTAGAWTLNTTQSVTFTGGANPQQVNINLATPITLAPGQSKGVYVVGTQSFGGGPVAYLSTAGGYSGPQSYQDGNLRFTGGIGSGGLFATFFGAGTPSDFRLYYGSVTYASSVPVTQIAGLPSGSAFPVGVTTNTFRVTDAAGNSSTCSFTVTVNDTQNPVITCPANITVTSPVGSCVATVNYAVTATDNCPGVTTALQSGLASGSSFPLGATTVTWRATDAAGNTSTCSFTVTVLDGQLPVITPLANVTSCVGSNAVFTATSTNALGYQWQAFSGGTWSNIPGATGPTYTVNNVTTSMNTNSFRVIVTGLCTTVTSSFATLFVNTLPVITLSSSRPPMLLPGQFLDITATGIPPGGSYVWLFNGVVMPGVTGNTLTNIGVNGIGSYSVRYTDLNGCVTTSAVLVVGGMNSDNLFVYPNPNFGQFQVRFFNQANENATVNVYNSIGQKVYQKAMVTTIAYTQIDIDLGSAASGMYVVELVNAAGKRVGAKQIIVRHR